MDAGEVAKKIVVKDGQPSILRELHVHFYDARAKVVGLTHRVDRILDRQCRILPSVGTDSVVSDGNWTHANPQEILRGAVLLTVIALRFVAGSRDAAAE